MAVDASRGDDQSISTIERGNIGNATLIQEKPLIETILATYSTRRRLKNRMKPITVKAGFRAGTE